MKCNFNKFLKEECFFACSFVFDAESYEVAWDSLHSPGCPQKEEVFKNIFLIKQNWSLWNTAKQCWGSLAAYIRKEGASGRGRTVKKWPIPVENLYCRFKHSDKIEESLPRLGRLHRKKVLESGPAGDTTNGSERMGGKHWEWPWQTGLFLTWKTLEGETDDLSSFMSLREHHKSRWFPWRTLPNIKEEAYG